MMILHFQQNEYTSNIITFVMSGFVRIFLSIVEPDFVKHVFTEKRIFHL